MLFCQVAALIPIAEEWFRHVIECIEARVAADLREYKFPSGNTRPMLVSSSLFDLIVIQIIAYALTSMNAEKLWDIGLVGPNTRRKNRSTLH